MPQAIWNGPYDALLANGGILRIGQQHEVTDADLDSAHWTPVGEPLFTPAPEPVIDPDPEPGETD